MQAEPSYHLDVLEARADKRLEQLATNAARTDAQHLCILDLYMQHGAQRRARFSDACMHA